MSDTPPEKAAEPFKLLKKRWPYSDFVTKASQDGSITKNEDPNIKMGRVLNESPKMRVVKPHIPHEEKKEEGKKAEEKEEKGGDENSGGVKDRVRQFDSMHFENMSTSTPIKGGKVKMEPREAGRAPPKKRENDGKDNEKIESDENGIQKGEEKQDAIKSRVFSQLIAITLRKITRSSPFNNYFIMQGWQKVSKTKREPEAGSAAAAAGVFGKGATKTHNTTTQDPSAAQELYLPTRVSGLYISPTIQVLPDCMEIATRPPGATEYHIQWSSKEKLAHDDTVTIPTVKDVTHKTVNKHGRTGTRVPGIFVANEEVEQSLLAIWTTAEGKKTIILIIPVDQGDNEEGDGTEVDGFVIV
ncbi:hypothetical protein J4E86_010972 [Alternaria arbusti]|uniref:uncharacterized protein n=1 Tax=Alternaria arbusti TaxID=232088 RepID=UPI002220D40C|nr:uncharacterized protein J4E86_010972 [Alternaria arbusti]KAI4940338.1 hypothetical protein J4E86_010972 [Alternaria arbusti]